MKFPSGGASFLASRAFRSGNPVVGQPRKICTALLLLAICPSVFGENANRQRALTVRDTVERSTVLRFFNTINYSPDGSRYLVMMSRGDVARNAVVVKFLTGLVTSLEDVAPREAASLSTAAYGATPVTVNNKFVWLDDNETIVFLWGDDETDHQVVALNLRTNSIKQLTHHPSGVLEFAVSEDGETILYTAFAKHTELPVSEIIRKGLTVDSTSGFSFLSGEGLDGWKKWSNVELYVTERSYQGRRIIVPTSLGIGYQFGAMKISPDARLALINLPVPIVEGWRRYDSPALMAMMSEAESGAEFPRLRQPYVLDIASGDFQQLWNAPTTGSEAFWSPDSRRVALGSTFIPVNRALGPGLKGEAAAVVDVVNGAFLVLSQVRDEINDRFVPAAWTPKGLELKRRSGDGESLLVRLSKNALHIDEVTPKKSNSKPWPVRVEVRQDLNTPPVMYAVRLADGAERRLLDLESTAELDVKLGQVQLVHWTAAGKQWTGRLYRAVGSKQAPPLVIQLKPFSRSEFSLLGSEDYPSTFAAQVFANRGIATLQMEGPDDGFGDCAVSPEEPKLVLAGIMGAIEMLRARGAIDPSRVGLSGFSRSGWYVQYTLTQSDFPFAAAVAADNMDSSYGQALIGGFAQYPEFNMDNGAEPFGVGLKAWLERSPGFNADRISTPLRMQVHGGGLAGALSHWEMFGRLRHLKKPVELYLVPSMDRGMHILQNPRQLLASREGIVDWFDFWLNGREDSDPSKKEQYQRWHKLRALHEADRSKVRRPRLEWQASPIGSGHLKCVSSRLPSAC